MKIMNARVYLFCLAIALTGVGFGCQQKSGDDEDIVAAEDASLPDTTPAPDADPIDPGRPCATSVDCDDGIDCTQDFCEASTATCEHIPTNFICGDDGNVCTRNTCLSGVGCIVEAEPQDGLSCNSGNACALEAICQTGVCEVSVERDCSDGNECTDDTCNPGSGCQFINNGDPCNDGSDFTSGDQCVNGLCTGAGGSNCLTPSDCDDGNPCTVLSCIDDVCQTNGAPCDDGVDCTVDACSPGGGCTNTPKNGLCGFGEICDAGLGCTECTADSECDDQSVCTFDTCLDGLCKNDPVFLNDDGKFESTDSLSCDDGSVCTLVSWCFAGACVSGLGEDFTKNCDDSNACTKDYCDPEFGCGHELFDGCDDPNPQPDPNPVVETCNGVDDDGDGQVDEKGADGCTPHYWDGDGDGYGKAGSTCLCGATSKYVPVAGDCDDSDPTVHENCNSGGVDPQPNPDPGNPNKYCEVRLTSPDYELKGWYTDAVCWDPASQSNWCVGPTAFKVWGDDVIVANAKCKSGKPCNTSGKDNGVGWVGDNCQSGLKVIDGLFQLSPDCNCSAKCIGPDYKPTDTLGNPNLYCTVKP